MSGPKLLLCYPRGFDAEAWARAHAQGQRPEPSHWGMHQAASCGFSLLTSRDFASAGPGALGRLFLGAARIDLDHLRRNAAFVRDADAIWTMSERDLLGLLALPLGLRKSTVTSSEVCWLLDEWQYLPPWRKWLYRHYLTRADRLLVPSRAVARSLHASLPQARICSYRFGIPHEALAREITIGGRPRPGPRLELLMPGNDLRRDWQTAAKAVSITDGVRLTMLSKHENVGSYAQGTERIRYVQGRDFRDLVSEYGACDAVLIASLRNLHGAGLTMMLEAASLAIPLIVAEDMSLQEYLDERHALIVPPNDPQAIARAVRSLRQEPEAARLRAEAARAHLLAQDMSSMGAARRRSAIILDAIRERAHAKSGAGSI